MLGRITDVALIASGSSLVIGLALTRWIPHLLARAILVSLAALGFH